MNSRAWKVTVTNSATMIAPRFNKDPMDCQILQDGENVLKGSYRRSAEWDDTAENSRLYWTPNGGTCNERPVHKYGAKTGSDGVTWVVVGVSRKYLDVSADTDNPCWISDGNSGGLEEGLKMDEFRPAYTYDGYNGEVWGIADSSDAEIGVKER